MFSSVHCLVTAWCCFVLSPPLNAVCTDSVLNVHHRVHPHLLHHCNGLSGLLRGSLAATCPPSRSCTTPRQGSVQERSLPTPSVPSGKRFRSITTKTSRHLNSFFPLCHGPHPTGNLVYDDPVIHGLCTLRYSSTDYSLHYHPRTAHCSLHSLTCIIYNVAYSAHSVHTVCEYVEILHLYIFWSVNFVYLSVYCLLLQHLFIPVHANVFGE